jgi:glycerol kinase
MRTLAIDQGTTTTRALLVDADGRVETIASLPHRQFYPTPEHVEHDPEELIGNILSCLDAASGVGDLGAVGIDNQGESCLGWDAESKRAVGPVIVWQDARTSDVTERLKAEGAEPMVLERAGLPLDPYFSASKLAWIVHENAAARRLADVGKLRLGTTDAFFLDRLTRRFETDITTASRTSLMNITTGEWDEELCRLFRVPIEALPRIVPSSGDFGALACGNLKAPLTASIVDQQASLYGHGCRKQGDAKITFGTGAFALQVTGELQRPRASGLLPTVAWQKTGEAPMYAVDGGVYCASSAVNWARDLGLFDDFAAIDTFDSSPAIARGLVFVPALAGLACPHWDRSARGTWLGLSLDASKSDLMQALLEGVALRTAEVVAAISKVSPPAEPVSIDGGMTRNSYFCQFLADNLQRELIVSDQPELTAIGTAALAAECVGRPFAFARSGRRVRPQAFREEWRAKFSAAIAVVKAFGSATAE